MAAPCRLRTAVPGDLAVRVQRRGDQTSMLGSSVVRPMWLILMAAATLPAQFTTRLSPATEQAFEDYRKPAEARMNWVARFTAAPSAGITIAPFGREGFVSVPHGMIHDWAAATVAHGATVDKVLAILQNYDGYKSVYAPEVTDSKLLSREGNSWRAYLRIVKHQGLTAVLNSEYDVEYRPLDQGRWAVISRSIKMTELDGARELAPGTGHGFLWRLNAYWLMEPRPNGVYLECRTISLSRDIPTGLGWAIRPLVASLPRDSLEATLEATVRALR